ncbi:MAG: diaminopimelate epimerase [Bacteroidetes bacterium]|nr:diaminopimelate epimerase [Bacteroidota bacterium]
MQLQFCKYQGTGNDFILIDNRTVQISLTRTQIAALCHRRFGIGADGLMMLETAIYADFKMVYYNSDGNESTMCGNGGRCIVAFAHQLGIIEHHTTFEAVDGLHQAEIDSKGIVRLQMIDVNGILEDEEAKILQTGSPHYVLWVDDVEKVDVVREGRKIRNRTQYLPDGINVNFVSLRSDGLHIRTYERGVEDETLSCGTGVTAAAIASVENQQGAFSIQVHTQGGTLRVNFEKTIHQKASKVWLIGPTALVFKGEVNI